MMHSALLIELSRRSIAFWYRVNDGDPLPLQHGEGHAVPLYFRVDDSGVFVGPSAERMFAKGERDRAFTDYFALVGSGAKVRIHGSEQPADVLLFEVVERYAETFLRDHVHGTGGLVGLRKELPLHFAFGPDLNARDRSAVIDLFKRGGYARAKGHDQSEAVLKAVHTEIKPDPGMALIWLVGSGDDLFVNYLPGGSTSPPDPIRLTGLGQDPRLPGLVELLFLEATESTRMSLNQERELPVLTEAGKAMLLRGGARLTSTITLADGETTFDASIKDAELEERARFSPAVKQVLDAIEGVLKKHGKDKRTANCLLAGDAITTPYYEGRLYDSFNRVLRLQGGLAEQYREELFRIAGDQPQAIGFRPDSSIPRPTKPSEPPPPPPPPPTPLDPVEVRRQEIAAQQARIIKDYDNEIKLGDFEIENQDLVKALGHFQKAANLKPNEPLPKEKVSELQRRIADIETATKGNEEKYKVSMEQGNVALQSYSFNVAEKRYEAAAKLKPLEPLPKQQLALVASWREKCATGAQKWPTTLLALFGGSIGAHRFYLNQTWRGIFSLLSFWTIVPALAIFLIDRDGSSVFSFWTNALIVVGLIRGVRFLFMGNARFLREYNRGLMRSNKGLIVMLILLAVLGAGGYYFKEVWLKERLSAYVGGLWFGGSPGREFVLYDQEPGSTTQYRLKVLRPSVEWSIFSPSEWQVAVEAELDPVVPGVEAYGHLAGQEMRSFGDGSLPRSLQLCVVPGGTVCVQFENAHDGSPMIRTQAPDGLVHTFATSQPAPSSDPAQNALYWANSQYRSGHAIRLGIFRKYSCEEGCWASFSEVRNGRAPASEFRCNGATFGDIDLSNGRVAGTGNFSNQRMIGQKFLFSTQVDESTATGPAPVLTGLFKFSKAMMGPEIKRMLDAAPIIDNAAPTPPEIGSGSDSGSETSSGYVDPDVAPHFAGNLPKYLFDNLRLPEAARLAGISGSVVVSFGVYPDGSLHDVLVLKGLGSGCDEEALRIINSMPDWVPGTKEGKPVNSLVKSLAIPFQAG